ncbi:helix-turn-helix domain-containing protein [Pseudomonas putida]|uniref:helix-turn-helix domain-containing protein n=2 Tax=Pseudomonas TaxID=286 RepID=UPI0009B5DEFE
MGEVYQINDWVKLNYKSSFAVEDLAVQANMSSSSLHRKFKAAIGMGPVQCQKQLRLVEARRQMLSLGATVIQAAIEVGYESVSQFSRGYKSMFGVSPSQDVKSHKGSE